MFVGQFPVPTDGPTSFAYLFVTDDPEAMAVTFESEAGENALLLFFAVGSAVFGFDDIGPVGVALAFRLVLLALAYAVGPVSGCHGNPAVTLGVLLSRAIGPWEGGRVCRCAARGRGTRGRRAPVGGRRRRGERSDRRAGHQLVGATVNGFGTFLVEVLLTFLLVLVVLMVTRTDAAPVSRDVDPTTAAPETARDVP